MVNIKYCKKCVMPSTRPGIKFDEHGVCYACKAYERQSTTDWTKRKEELKALCDKHRKNDGSYDCIVTSSGGKDSVFQVHVIKEEMGMNPLLVTVTDNFTHTKAGQHNFLNILDKFDCSNIMYSPKMATERKLVRKYFEEEGKPTIYIDRLIYTYPLHIALALNIPLIIYGEDINYTYGGEQNSEKASAMDQINNGVADAKKDIEEADPFCKVPERYKELEVVYLSYFVPWNSYKNYEYALSTGFKDLNGEWDRSNHVESFDQIDSIAYLLHPWMKYPKFGHSVATDYASKFVRYGIYTRDQAVKAVLDRDGNIDNKTIKDFCEFAGYTNEEFLNILNKFYNRELLTQTTNGWKLKPEVIERLKNP